MILFTGGTDFIGPNFVQDWLTHSPEPELNVDKRTYAGNLGNLAVIRGDAWQHFVRPTSTARAHDVTAAPARATRQTRRPATSAVPIYLTTRRALCKAPLPPYPISSS
jgi:hypothetical protein